MADQHKDFSYSTVQVGSGVIGSTSGTTITLGAGDGAKFPIAPFNIVVWPSNAQPTNVNAEIMRVPLAGVNGDVLTVTRNVGPQGSLLNNIALGYQVAHGHTVNEQLVAERDPATLCEIMDDLCDFDGTRSAHCTKLVNTAGSVAAQNATTGHPGLLLIQAATSAGSAFLIGAGASNTYPIPSGGPFEVEFLVQMPSVVNDSDFRAGIGFNHGNPPVSGVYFEKLQGDTDFFLVLRNNNSQSTRIDSGIAATVNNWFALRLIYDGTNFWYSINRAAPVQLSFSGVTFSTAQSYAAFVMGAFNTNTAVRNYLADYLRYLVPSLGR